MSAPAIGDAHTATARLNVRESSFVVVSNGFVDGPAQALRDYLITRGAGHLTVILHPLQTEDGSHHEISEWIDGTHVRTRKIWVPSRPPFTYPLDLMVPVFPPRADVYFGFNCLAASIGVAARGTRRIGKVVYWCVDFVDRRFGVSPLTLTYEVLDGFCCRHADARFELSEEALRARSQRHGGDEGRLAPTRVVPMGAWIDRVQTTSNDGFEARNIVFLGHLVPMQGVTKLIDAFALLRNRGVQFRAEIVGRGPELPGLREAAMSAGVGEAVLFHGFVPEHADVEKILAGGSIGVAPYDTTIDSFKRFADPGKLKAYLAAGLPIVTTSMAPNGLALQADGCAEVVEFAPGALAAAIEGLLGDHVRWRAMHAAALRRAREFDWNGIIGPALEALGINTGG